MDRFLSSVFFGVIKKRPDRSCLRILSVDRPFLFSYTSVIQMFTGTAGRRHGAAGAGFIAGFPKDVSVPASLPACRPGILLKAAGHLGKRGNSWNSMS
jgi:hypothetical protein